MDLRLDRLHGFAELACRGRHRLNVGRGLAGGRRRLGRLPPAACAIEDSVCAVSVNSPVIRSVLASTVVKVERNASISASIRCRRLDLLGVRLVLGRDQGEVVVGAGLQAGLHDGQRLQQTAEFVAAPDLDMVGEISGGDPFGDMHGGEDRPAQRDRRRPGAISKPTSDGADRKRQHGGARLRHRCFSPRCGIRSHRRRPSRRDRRLRRSRQPELRDHECGRNFGQAAGCGLRIFRPAPTSRGACSRPSRAPR